MEIRTYDDLQTLFSERTPYEVMELLGQSVIRFHPLFLKYLRESFTTGCVLKMSEESLKFTNDFIGFCDGTVASTPALLALDKVLVDIVNCTYEDITSDCTLNSVYEFNECGV